MFDLLIINRTTTRKAKALQQAKLRKDVVCGIIRDCENEDPAIGTYQPMNPYAEKSDLAVTHETYSAERAELGLKITKLEKELANLHARKAALDSRHLVSA